MQKGKGPKEVGKRPEGRAKVMPAPVECLVSSLPNKLITVAVKICGKNFNAIVDTGASVSLIKKSVFLTLGKDAKKSDSIMLRIGDGTRHLISEQVTLSLTFQNLTKNHTFYIYKDLPYDILLSLQFICDFYITIRANTQQISIASEDYLLIHEGNADKIQVVEETRFKPLTGRAVKAKVKGVRAGVINVVNVAERPLLVREGVYLVDNFQTVLLMENVNQFAVTVQKNQTIAVGVPHASQDNADLLSVESDQKDEITAEMFQIADTLEPKEKDAIRELLFRNRDVFATKTSQLTATHLLEHHIRLIDDHPFCQRPPRTSQEQRDAADAVLDHLVTHDYIEPSISPFSSRYLMVKKKDGGWRMCIDYRQLNKQTEKDAYSLPSMDEILEQLAGSELFSIADMINGFYQVYLHKESRPYTAFYCHRGLYQWKRLPMGLSGSPAIFQRILDIALRELKPQSVANYLDDLIIFGKDHQTHRENLQKVLDKLRDANLKLSITKCFFGVSEIVFLGVSVSKLGFRPDKRKVEAVEKMKKPMTVRQCREFLGLCGFFRKFIKDFSILAAPLHALTKKDVKFEWTEECQNSFDMLKRKLTTAPLLHHFDPSKKILLVTDASDIGVGAILQLEVDGQEVPVGYWSRLLNKSERNYCASDKEVLAVVWGLKKVRHFVQGRKFTIVTDHSALVHLMNTLDAHGRWARWIVLLLGYTFEIKHRKGSLNVAADALSRQPLEVYDNVSVEDDVEDLVLALEQIDIARLQQADPYCKMIAKKMSPNSGFSLKDGILIKSVTTEDGSRDLIVLPEKLIPEVMKACHDHSLSGHGGYLRTLAKLQQRFFRRRLAKLVRRYINSCEFCRKRKPRSNFPEGIPSSLPTTAVPFQIQCIDFSGPINQSLEGHRYILLSVDVATRYVISRATKDQTSATVINFIEEELIKRVGKPDKLISDNGPAFISAEFQSFLQRWKIQHCRITPFHPQSNGIVESANKTYGIMLSSVFRQFPSIWHTKTRDIDYAMNTSVSKGTGRTPYSLVFMKDPPLAIDSLIHPLSDLVITRDQEEADMIRMTATENLRDQQRATEQYREQHLIPREYGEGEEVLVWKPNPEPNLAKKLTSHWVGPVKIKRKLPNLPATYEIEPNEITARWKSLSVNVMNLRKWYPRDRILQSDPNPDPTKIDIMIEADAEEADEVDRSSVIPAQSPAIASTPNPQMSPVPGVGQEPPGLAPTVTADELARNQDSNNSNESQSVVEGGEEPITEARGEPGSMEPVIQGQEEQENEAVEEEFESCGSSSEEEEEPVQDPDAGREPAAITRSGRRSFKPNMNFYFG